MKVIITDVRYRMSLPIIRSLGKEGAEITCTDPIGTHGGASLGFYSKYTKRCVNTPTPDKGEEFLTALEGITEERQVLIPVGMDTLTLLSENRERVSEKFDVALPPIDSLNLANDKYALMKLAKELGVPCPRTEVLREGESVEAFAMRAPCPAVIKYRAGELLHLDPKDRYAIVKTPLEIARQYEKMHTRQEYPLAQEYVEGEGFGVSVVMDKEHNPMTVFCHRRLHEYPISGGPSCLCESAWNDELVEYAVKLLRALDWVGVAMVEFKGSADNGYKLMEINPRLWGSSALAPIAGCNIGGAIARVAMGKLAPSDNPMCEYKIGRRMRFVLQDTLAFFAYLKKSDKKFVFAIKYIGSLLNPRTKDGVFTLNDPKPGMKYLVSALKKKDKIIR